MPPLSQSPGRAGLVGERLQPAAGIRVLRGWSITSLWVAAILKRGASALQASGKSGVGWGGVAAGGGRTRVARRRRGGAACDTHTCAHVKGRDIISSPHPHRALVHALVLFFWGRGHKFPIGGAAPGAWELRPRASLKRMPTGGEGSICKIHIPSNQIASWKLPFPTKNWRKCVYGFCKIISNYIIFNIFNTFIIYIIKHLILFWTSILIDFDPTAPCKTRTHPPTNSDVTGGLVHMITDNLPIS